MNVVGSTSSSIYKIIIIGPSNVGKTCLACRFCNGSFCSEIERKSTIGVDFFNRFVTVNDEKIMVWDTAGQERFRCSMGRHYYRNVDAVLFVYDITDRASFDALTTFVNECSNFIDYPVVSVLVGNKLDEVKNRSVSTKQGQKFAEFYGMQFFEVSAKDNCNSADIDHIFYSVAEKVSSKNAVGRLSCTRGNRFKDGSQGINHLIADDMLLLSDDRGRNASDNSSCGCSA